MIQTTTNAPTSAEEVGVTRPIPMDRAECNQFELGGLIADCDDHLAELEQEATKVRAERGAYAQRLAGLA